jgi:chromosomal replication initiation ATPase DnaA
VTSTKALHKLHEVSVRTGISVADILGRHRERQFVLARHEFWTELRGMGFSYPDIATFCEVDHTSVIHGVRGHRERVAKPFSGPASLPTSGLVGCSEGS